MSDPTHILTLIETAEPKRTWKEKCECNLREKLVGDGCHFCNPEYAIAHDRAGEE